MNPADVKHVALGNAQDFPRPIGYEVAGVVTAVGPDTEIASGPVAVGDEVLAFRISGGWATELTVPAGDVFAKPASLSFGEAANLLLAGCTALGMLRATGVGEGDTILVHGASGASESACCNRPRCSVPRWSARQARRTMRRCGGSVAPRWRTATDLRNAYEPWSHRAW